MLKCRRGELRPPVAGWYRTGQRRHPRPSSHGLGNTRLQPWLSFGSADPNLWRRNLREYDAVNYQGALNVIHAALDNGAKRVLHTSAESILTLAANFVGDPVEQRELEKGDMLGPHCLTRIRRTTR